MMRQEFPSRPVGLSHRVAQSLSERIKALAGIRVDPRNVEFLSFRLDNRLRELGLASYEDYLDRLNAADGEDELKVLVEQLATHTTSFFRESAHFDWLERVGLPDLIRQGAGRDHSLTIWSAACSSGQELWSAGMVLDKVGARISGGLRWSLFGSDISDPILQRARQAIYLWAELGGLPLPLRKAYLLRSREGSELSRKRTLFRIAPALRNRARFENVNLLAPTSQVIPMADVIFLRNVLIYFSPADRIKVIGHVTRRLRPGGFLLLGHTDGQQAGLSGLRQVAPATFRKDETHGI